MRSILTFSGGMDQDTSPIYLKKGDVVLRRNARVSVGDGGDALVNKPLKGTVSIPITLPAGTNKAVGWVEYLERGGFIYCNYNSKGNHGIYWFDGTDNHVLLIHSVLNFLSTDIVDCRIIGDAFVWTDNHNEPRILSISRALMYSDTGRVSGVISEGGSTSVGTISGTIKAYSADVPVGNISGTVKAYSDNAVDHGDISGTVSAYYLLGTVSGTVNEQII